MIKLPKVHRRDWVSFDGAPQPIITNRKNHSKDPLIYLIRSSRERRLSQINSLSPVGNRAKLDFIDTYKNISLLTQKNRQEKVEDSPSVAYLNRVEKTNLYPEPFGIVRRKGPDNKIDIHSYSMGDVYANAFSEGIDHCKDVKEINLSNNRLTENGCSKILQKIKGKTVRKIILAENKIGQKSISEIIGILEHPQNRLKWIDIENTGVNDRVIAQLCKFVANNTVVRHLNLAKNNLGYFSSIAIKDMLKNNRTLKRLDLHWNNFRTQGALELLEGLSENIGLKELDLSWNSFGRDTSLDVVKNLGKSLKDNTDLLHLDISFNYFSKPEIEVLASYIKDNHTLIGLHVLGNECYLDSKGFLIPNENIGKIQQGHFFNRMFSEETKVPKKKSASNCWICERWIEVSFTWTPRVSGEASLPPIYLHLESDNYESDLMTQQKSGVFLKTRVVPQRKIMFFFSSRQGAMKNSEIKTHGLIQPLELPKIGKVSVVNYAQLRGTECDIKDLFKSKPRVPGDVYEPSAAEYEKIPWSISISVFKDYRLDTEEYLRECFEFDWKASKLQNFTKTAEVQDLVYSTLSPIYQDINEAYKTLSAYSGNELFCVTQNVLIDFLNQCNLIDNLFQVSDLGVNWNSANASRDKGEIYNAGNGLCRYEFMEILVRIANDRYVRNKVCKNSAEALVKFINEDVIEVIRQYDNRKIRNEEIMVEEIDCFFKAHKAVFDAVFKKYSGKKSVPGQKPFINLEEFRLLCVEAELMSESFTTREIDVCFSQAMMTQVDILFKKRHLEMSFVEFLEAVCRVGRMTSREEGGLKKKMEGMVGKLLGVCPSSVVNSFVKPTEDTYFKMMYRQKQVD